MMPINLPIYNFEFNNLDHRPVAKSFLPRFRAISHRDYLIYNCTSAKIYTKIVQTTCFIGSTSDIWFFSTLEKPWSKRVATYTCHIAYSLIQFRYCVQYARNALKEHFLVNFWGRHIQKTKSKKILLAKVETRFSRSGTQIITDREP